MLLRVTGTFLFCLLSSASEAIIYVNCQGWFILLVNYMRCPMAVWPPHPESVASCRNETEMYLIILVTLQESRENNGYRCNLTPREARSLSGSVCVISGPQRLTPSVRRGHGPHSNSNILSCADKFHNLLLIPFRGFLFLSYFKLV